MQPRPGDVLKRVRKYLDGDAFCMTYGDGVGDIDIKASIAFHRAHGRLATMTATQPPGRFGLLGLAGTRVTQFLEKPHGDGGWINGGYFVLSPKVIDYIDGDATLWEQEPLETLAKQGQLEAWIHNGFWQPMDTLRDKSRLEALWAADQAPWKVWP